MPFSCCCCWKPRDKKTKPSDNSVLGMVISQLEDNSQTDQTSAAATKKKRNNSI